MSLSTLYSELNPNCELCTILLCDFSAKLKGSARKEVLTDMFYDVFKNLCNSNNTTPTAVLKQLNISTSKGTSWKNGSEPSLKYLIRISEFFGVSIDFLVGRETNGIKQIACNSDFKNNNGNIAISSKQNIKNPATDENIDVIEFEKIIKRLTPREKTKLMNMVYEFEEKQKGE